MKAERPLAPVLRRRLVRLNAEIERILGLEAITAKRDPRTGSFTAGATLNPKSVRAAWSLHGKRAGPTNVGREAFKAQLLAALRAPRA